MKHQLMKLMILFALLLTAVACGGSGSEPAASEPAASESGASAPVAAAPSTGNESGNQSESGSQASDPASAPSAPESAPAAESGTTQDTSATTGQPTAAESPSQGFVPTNQRPMNTLPPVEDDKVVITAAWHIDKETGYMNVIGSVLNKTNTPITGMINVIYYDTSGQPITVVDVLAESSKADKVSFSSPIAPGDIGYFRLSRNLERIDGEVARVETSLSYIVPETTSPLAEFLNLQSVRNEYEGVTVSGSVKNVGNISCKYPSLVVGYLKDGRVWEIDGSSLDVEILEPGQEVSFEFDKYLIPVAFDEVDVVIDCSPTSFPRP